MRNLHWNTYFFLTVLVLVYLLRAGSFIVYEGSQVIVTQFGKVFSKPYTEPGLYFRAPFIHKTHYFDKRIFTLMIHEVDIPTKNRIFLNVDVAVHWKITDLKVFMENLETIEKAKDLLENIASSTIRNVISSNNLVEIIRNSNQLPHNHLKGASGDPEERRLEEENAEEMKRNLSSHEKHHHKNEDSLLFDDNFEGGENEMIFDTIYLGRNYLVNKMMDQISFHINSLGINVVNVMLTGINYNERVKNGVYARMRTERIRIAERYRSLGESRLEEITGKISETYNEIIAPAISKAEIIRGKADAFAVKTYASEYKKDLRFFNYWRTLNALKTSFPKMEKSILSTKSDFLKVLQRRPQFESKESEYFGRSGDQKIINQSVNQSVNRNQTLGQIGRR